MKNIHSNRMGKIQNRNILLKITQKIILQFKEKVELILTKQKIKKNEIYNRN